MLRQRDETIREAAGDPRGAHPHPAGDEGRRLQPAVARPDFAVRRRSRPRRPTPSIPRTRSSPAATARAPRTRRRSSSRPRRTARSGATSTPSSPRGSSARSWTASSSSGSSTTAVDMNALFAEFVRGYLLPLPGGRPTRTTPARPADRADVAADQAVGSAFARATSPSHARLGFGCRSNVSRSQRDETERRRGSCPTRSCPARSSAGSRARRCRRRCTRGRPRARRACSRCGGRRRRWRCRSRSRRPARPARAHALRMPSPTAGG